MKRATRRSRDLFHDDADSHKLKARLVFGIAKLIETKGLTNAVAADLSGIARPDLSKILRGKITASLERTAKSLKASGTCTPPGALMRRRCGELSAKVISSFHTVA